MTDFKALNIPSSVLSKIFQNSSDRTTMYDPNRYAITNGSEFSKLPVDKQLKVNSVVELVIRDQFAGADNIKDLRGREAVGKVIDEKIQILRETFAREPSKMAEAISETLASQARPEEPRQHAHAPLIQQSGALGR